MPLDSRSQSPHYPWLDKGKGARATDAGSHLRRGPAALVQNPDALACGDPPHAAAAAEISTEEPSGEDDSGGAREEEDITQLNGKGEKMVVWMIVC